MCNRLLGFSRSLWVSAILGLPQNYVLGLLRYVLYRPTADVCPLLVHRELLHQLFGYHVAPCFFWNDLPLVLRSLLVVYSTKFYRSLKFSLYIGLFKFYE